MKAFKLIDIEWTFYSWFSFEILSIETETQYRSLFGISFDKDYFEISILFLNIR